VQLERLRAHVLDIGRQHRSIRSSPPDFRLADDRGIDDRKIDHAIVKTFTLFQ